MFVCVLVGVVIATKRFDRFKTNAAHVFLSAKYRSNSLSGEITETFFKWRPFLNI